MGGFFGPLLFIILKSSHQDLSNEGSNFILSQVEVVHLVAQTCPLFDINLGIRHDSEFDKF